MRTTVSRAVVPAARSQPASRVMVERWERICSWVWGEGIHVGGTLAEMTREKVGGGGVGGGGVGWRGGISRREMVEGVGESVEGAGVVMEGVWRLRVRVEGRLR